jgi:hypothetical protein
MFTKNNDNTTSTRNNQTAQKSQKEKTMATGHTNSVADIDVTKPLTPEEQALVVESTKEEPTNATAKSKESSANNETKKKAYISSFVGDCKTDPDKGNVVNLGKDVLFVQQNLNRLGILSDKDFAKEKPTSEKEVSKSKIPATIEAIGYFQERVLLTPKANVDKQVWPGFNTITTLANITQTKFRAQLFEFTKKQVREKIEATLKEMSAAREAEIERIKNEPATDENVRKLYSQADDIEGLGRLLKDYAVHNPEFVLKAYSLVGYSDTDNLTRAIMFYLNDNEIQQLSSDLDAKFYDSMDEGVTTDTEYALMKKLKKGRGVRNVESENSVSSDLESVREMVDYSLSGSVGENGNNYIIDVRLVAGKLKEKYKISKESIDNGVCDQTLIEAIGQFQIDNKLLNKKGEPDYVIDPGFGSYKKLFGVKSKYNSGVEDIHAGRKTVARVLNRNNSDEEKGKQNYTLDKLEYNSSTGIHGSGTESKEYYEKIDVLAQKMNISGDSDVGKILSIARKAATDEAYYNKFTKDVSAKLALTPEVISDNGVNLSPVLIERMRKYHKFLSAIGLFKGDMYSSKGGGVRSAETAHIWCAQWIIAAEAAGSDNAATYVKKTKEILLEMYQEQKNDKPDYIIDEDKNQWAKKEHFKEDKEGKVTMDWDKIKAHVATIPGGRDKYTAPAASGYEEDSKRRPVPPKYPLITNHKTGEAIDINYRTGFQVKEDSLLDLIGLNFGVIRNGGATEWWHYELTDLQLSSSEKEKSQNKSQTNKN